MAYINKYTTTNNSKKQKKEQEVVGSSTLPVNVYKTQSNKESGQAAGWIRS